MTAPPNDGPKVPDALAELSGTVLENRYRMGRVLGSGGMGAVFEARHLRLDRPVAIKVLRPAYASEKEYIARFLREAKSASKIRHRNVVEILDYGETESGLVYSVMEFLVGQDLEELLRAQPQRRLPWARACGLLIQIASGLRAAHKEGVIHRDIKPANCFLTEEDEQPLVKLVDFGIAKLEGGDRGHTLTGTAQVLGTPSYIAPELVRSQDPASPRSDIYALGVVAYRMLVGKVPFTAGTVFELLRKACFDPVPSLREQVPEVPAEVEALVLEMLAKDPQQRPADMRTVRDRLVALSRRTLGAEAVAIPGSSALPLSVVDSVPPPGATEDTTLPREPVGGTTERPLPGEVGITAVMLEPLPETPDARAPRPPGTPQTVVVSPSSSGSPREVVHDPGSSSMPAGSESGATVPAVGESTLRSLEASGSIERPRNRGALWLALSGIGALAVAGVFVVPGMLGDDEATDAGELAAQTADPGVSAAPEPEESDMPGTTGAAGESTGVLAEAAASTGATSAGLDDESADDVVTVTNDTTAPDVGTPAAKPEPRPKRTKPKPAPKPTGPPKDSTVIRSLKRTIASKCSAELKAGAVTVKFAVTTRGGVIGLKVSPAGAAETCAKAVVQGAKFRERSKSELLEFKVG